MAVFALPVPRVAWLSDLHLLDHRPHRLAIRGRLVGPTGGARTGPGVGEPAAVAFRVVLKREDPHARRGVRIFAVTPRERLPTSSLPTGAPTGPVPTRCTQREP